MPIFEYKCRDCGKEFEELVLSSKTEPTPCPACKSEKTDRKTSRISAATGRSGGVCKSSGFS